MVSRPGPQNKVIHVPPALLAFQTQEAFVARAWASFWGALNEHEVQKTRQIHGDWHFARHTALSVTGWWAVSLARYDFFVVSQTVKNGCVAPTHYNVIYDTSQLKPDHVQRLTYKLCHMYYNWSVSALPGQPACRTEGISYLQKCLLLQGHGTVLCTALRLCCTPAQHAQLVLSHLLQGPAVNLTCVRGGRRAPELGSLGVFASVLLLCWGYVQLFSQISINNRQYKFYKWADFGGPGVFVAATACLFKLPENNCLLFLFSPFCRVLSEYLLLASTLINWLSLWVRVFTENQTWCFQTDCTTFEAVTSQTEESNSSLGNLELSGLLV